MSRLTQLVQEPLSPVTLQYDAAGRRTLLTQQLQFGAKTMTFDANGNLTSLTDSTGTTTFTWDARNRLSAMSGTNLAADFAYDVFGRRGQKIIDGRSFTYQYDGPDVVRETIGGVVANYLRSLSIDEPFTRTDTSAFTPLAYLADTLGSTLALTDASGALTSSYTYEPFGRTVASGLLIDTPFQFTGRENDNTGLYYYRERYYHVDLQRFASQDPIGVWDGANLYLYVGANPVSRIDPFGLDWEYAQSTGRLTHVDNQTGTRTLEGTGYSGYGEALNNPAMQEVGSQGPIPQGTYTIGPQQLNITAPPARTQLPASMRLEPRPGTDTFERGGFLIHGGNFSLMNSSRGCIVLPLNVRNRIGSSGDTTLRVVP